MVNSPKQRRYRNNILFSIGNNWEEELQIGPMSTIAGVKVVDEACVNQNASQLSIDICKIVKRWIQKHSALGQVIYPEFEGFWRHIIIKENTNKDYIVSFRFNDFEKHKDSWNNEKSNLIKYLLIHGARKGYNLKGVYYQKCLGTAEPSRSDIFHKIYFRDNLYESILGYVFVINVGCFFQVNTRLARILYNIVQGFFREQRGDVLLDMCCGVGMFGILMSKYFNYVIGMDNNPCNSELVYENLKINRVINYKYLEGNVEDNIDSILSNDRQYSIVVNPPRRGLYKNFTDMINTRREFIKDIVYVSCNGESLARDLTFLGDGWEIEKIVPLDQFPNTNHYEIIVKMRNKMFI